MSAQEPSTTGRTLGPATAVLAFDVGGTDIKSALFDASGQPHGLRRTPTPHDGEHTAEAVAARLAVLAADLRAAHPWVEPAAAGVLVPGIVDADRGVGVYASNLGWRDAPVRDLAGGALGLPVVFDHDVRTAGLAEHKLGAGRGYDDVCVIVIGTGIAGTLILDSRIRPAQGYAGEIGHSPVAVGPECACGARGCLEAVASAGAIARRYAERAGGSRGAVALGAREVLARARAGEPLAAEIWGQALDALALSIVQLNAIVAPQAVVIGGGLSRAGTDLFGPLRERVYARLSFHRRPAILPAQLQGDAGLLGAALIARERAGTSANRVAA
jgi:glucokinase